MKKSKIIVPALGILLLSTAASISGTVAWFTATRTFSTHVSSFGVGSVDGNLSATCVGVLGTEAMTTTVTNDTIKFAVGSTESILADASYVNSTTASERLLYIDDAVVSEEGHGVNETKFSSLGLRTAGTPAGAAWKAGTQDSKDYYYAVVWQIQLTYNYGAIDKDTHIFFDDSLIDGKEQITATAAASGKTSIESGIRFCFEEKGLVYAPCFDATANTAGVKHVATTTTVAATADANLIKKGDTRLTKAEDNINKATAAGNKAYLGTVTKSAPTLTVTVVSWLDGLDANVKSGDLYDLTVKFSGKLNFYCRTSSATNEA